MWLRRIKTGLKVVLGLLFIGAGLNHFISPDFYLRIMPPFLPWHRELVYISGAAEMLLGVLLLIRKTSIIAAWGLLALLVAVFPANLHMALNSSAFPELPPAALWVRLPFQAVLMAWAYCYTKPDCDR